MHPFSGETAAVIEARPLSIEKPRLAGMAVVGFLEAARKQVASHEW